MIVRIDTREQDPLEFQIGQLVKSTEITTLPFADYWAEEDGHISNIVFERKSLPDLFSTLTKGMVRFKKELYRAKAAKSRLVIIVEGTESQCYQGVPYSRVHGIQILRTIATLWVKSGVETWFFSSRADMKLRMGLTWESYFKHREVK